MKDAQVTLWIDGDLKAQADWTDQVLLPKEGRIGLGGGGGELHFDNFVITSDDIRPVQPEAKLATTWGRLKRPQMLSRHVLMACQLSHDSR